MFILSQACMGGVETLRNFSVMDTLETDKLFVIQRFPLFKGHFRCIAIHLVLHKQSVLEKFLLLGEFVIRGSL